MLFPAGIEEKLGFHSIRELLSASCHSNAGRARVEAIRFSTHRETIWQSLQETEESRQILLLPTGFPAFHVAEVDNELDYLRADGAFVEVDILLEIRSSLLSVLEVVVFFRKQDKQLFPLISARANEVGFEKAMLSKLEEWIDDKGRIRDDASEALQKVRSSLHARRMDVDKRLDKIFRQAKKEGWVEEHLEPTVRNGRLVIPMSATHKRKVKGFIHDESSSGQTVFLEPEDIFNTNNLIRELELAERREIVKILIAAADYLRPSLGEMKAAFVFLGWLDFLQAKARFALKTKAILPRLKARPGLEWYGAFHPLLFLSHQAQGKAVVPMNLRLDEHQRILVISGPNAGGKSVCLKTAGLLQYMLQCGLLIPGREGSESGIFQKLFIDIGDEQSLENDLSTYSSHLVNMQYFADHADTATLFLVDEMGSGTEPQLGGAIAESILEVLNSRKAFGVVTTHYTNLKLMAGKQEGIVNGAMAFDRSKMEPLYKLEMGRPGSSFAFEIARKTGLDEAVINRAIDLAGRAQFDFDRELTEIDTRKKELEEKSKQFSMADSFLAEVVDKYEKLHRELAASRDAVMEKARQEAARVLAGSNQLIERTIKEIRESQADKEKTKVVREEFRETKALLDKALEAETPPHDMPMPREQEKTRLVQKRPKPSTQQPTAPPNQANTPLKTGDQVLLQGQRTPGIIEKIKGDEAVVTFGSVKMKCSTGRLRRPQAGEALDLGPARPSGRYTNLIHDLNQRAANFQPTLDLRGKRAEEAIQLLQLYMDEAILLEVFEVRILHGKGDGILRERVREYMQAIHVKAFRDEILELGGHGITVVMLR